MESRGMTIRSFKCSILTIRLYVIYINTDDVNKIVTPCFVKIENITKPPPPPPPPSQTE